MTRANIIVIMKKFGMLRELGNGTQRLEVLKCYWVDGAMSLLVATVLQFEAKQKPKKLKKKKQTHPQTTNNPTQHL